MSEQWNPSLHSTFLWGKKRWSLANIKSEYALLFKFAVKRMLFHVKIKIKINILTRESLYREMKEEEISMTLNKSVPRNVLTTRREVSFHFFTWIIKLSQLNVTQEWEKFLLLCYKYISVCVHILTIIYYISFCFALMCCVSYNCA